MFPSPTIDHPARSIRERMRGALDSALEFATLGEATLDGLSSRTPVAPVHAREHPHRRALVRPTRPRRDGAIPPRAPVCTAPVSSTPAPR